MQYSVARKLIRQGSTRNYAGGIDDCLAGHGVGKSSVSRRWKIATAAELEDLCQRPVPLKLVALLLDRQGFRGEHLIVGLGVDGEGQKHVLGLWHGVAENSMVVRARLG